MPDAFQQRFRELLRGGALVSEARTQALKETGAKALFRRGDVVELSEKGRETFPKMEGERIVVGFSNDGRCIWLKRPLSNARQSFHASFWVRTKSSPQLRSASDAPQP